jgi:hypothetical protein
MAITIHQIRPVAHVPLVLGVLRKLDVAVLIDTLCPPILRCLSGTSGESAALP